MSAYLGIDTSNYTTSVALLNRDNTMLQHRLPLPVKKGSLGLKQSDAVFLHTKQLPDLIEQIFQKESAFPHAVGVSTRPRDIPGSYMPCFLTGEAAARTLAAALKAPLYRFSHQAGHIAAALYGSGRLDLLEKPFIAFHISGGTTEGLLVKPDNENVFLTQIVAGTLDLNAGQVIDRVGAMLSLDFPAGRELDQLAVKCKDNIKANVFTKGSSCSLSGIENKCRDMLSKGYQPENIARFAVESVLYAVMHMTDALLKQYGNLPLVYAGGVMSNSIIRAKMSERYDCVFAYPQFSSDNAAGVALLAKIKHHGD